MHPCLEMIYAVWNIGYFKILKKSKVPCQPSYIQGIIFHSSILYKYSNSFVHQSDHLKKTVFSVNRASNVNRDIGNQLQDFFENCIVKQN